MHVLTCDHILIAATSVSTIFVLRIVSKFYTRLGVTNAAKRRHFFTNISVPLNISHYLICYIACLTIKRTC